jgi:hypothetical protein
VSVGEARRTCTHTHTHRARMGLTSVRPRASRSTCTPTMRPRPRTCLMCGCCSCSSPVRSSSPMRPTWARNAGCDRRSNTTSPARHASGCPAKVLPWSPGCSTVLHHVHDQPWSTRRRRQHRGNIGTRTLGDVLLGADGADGDAVAEGLGERHHVRGHAGPLVCPQLARAREPALGHRHQGQRCVAATPPALRLSLG